MPGLSSNPIVRRALELTDRHPDWRPIDVLDAAMDSHHSTHPDFEIEPVDDGYADWLDPPSPFAALLRRVFAPDMKAKDFSPDSEEWQRVIELFGERYNLWR